MNCQARNFHLALVLFAVWAYIVEDSKTGAFPPVARAPFQTVRSLILKDITGNRIRPCYSGWESVSQTFTVLFGC